MTFGGGKQVSLRDILKVEMDKNQIQRMKMKLRPQMFYFYFFIPFMLKEETEKKMQNLGDICESPR